MPSLPSMPVRSFDMRGVTLASSAATAVPSRAHTRAAKNAAVRYRIAGLLVLVGRSPCVTIAHRTVDGLDSFPEISDPAFPLSGAERPLPRRRRGAHRATVGLSCGP